MRRTAPYLQKYGFKQYPCFIFIIYTKIPAKKERLPKNISKTA